MGGSIFKQSGWQLLFIALFVFALYSNVTMAVRNYHLNQRTDALQSQVNSEALHNQKLSLLLNYYKSASYQDVQARAQLGMKKPTETTLIILGVTQPTTTLSDQLDQQIQDESASQSKPISNFSRWWQFFFG
jgi:hypothetical protein